MALKIGCTFAAIFYTIVQAERYFKNEDTSNISFRPFNIRPQDNYPDLTFCLEGGHLSQAIEEFRVSEDTFINVLKGNTELSHIGLNSFEQISRTHSDMYFINLNEVILKYTIRTNKNTTSYTKANDSFTNEEEKISAFFQTTYMDPGKFCFTRNSQSEKGNTIVRKEDKIVIDLKHISASTKFQIHLNYPGQFIRFMEIPVAETIFKMNDNSQKMILTIPDITILRKRSRPSQPCEETAKDDSHDLRINVMQKVQCKPSYWKHLESEEHFPICQTSQELQKIYKNLKDIGSFLSNDTEPCSAMLIPSAVQKDSVFGSL